MKFYNRASEISALDALWEQSKNQARMVVLTGRRRVGKTMLSLHCQRNREYLYLFVAKKSEVLLCEEFLEDIQAKFDVPVIGEITSFRKIFALLIEIAKKQHLTVIIDEFQEFFNINPSVYSDMQKMWDLNKSCQLNLILIGSASYLMSKIFMGSKAPLFGLADKLKTF